jgi:hypothetical protein
VAAIPDTVSHLARPASRLSATVVSASSSPENCNQSAPRVDGTPRYQRRTPVALWRQATATWRLVTERGSALVRFNYYGGGAGRKKRASSQVSIEIDGESIGT